MKDINISFRRRKVNKKPIIIASLIVSIMLLTVLIIAGIGTVKKTDKGITYRRFFVTAKEKWIVKNDKVYYFDKSGYALTGWGDVEGNTYLFDENGVMKTGWYESEGKKYHLDNNNGILAKGFVTVDDKPYYFSTNDGVMQTGIIKEEDKIVAQADENGVLSTGATNIEGVIYCFNATGEAKAGWTDIGNDTYYCNEDGSITTGRVQIDDSYYLFEDTGVLKKSGWIEDANGNKSYAYEDGKLAVGRVEIDGKKYCFTSNGTYKTGWVNTGTERCYVSEDGSLLTGEQVISGVTFQFDENGCLVNQVSDETKMVALTFDDGPSNNTDTILDVLEEFDVKATFFVVGSRVSTYSAQLKREADLGCEIGSHTYNHSYLTKLSVEDMQKEIDDTNNIVTQVTGHETTCIRPPGGFYNSDVINRINCPVVMWDVDTLDWKSRNAESVAQIATSNIKDGDIILMHDLYSSTAQAVKSIVPALISQGFQIVTVSELLNAKCQNGSVEGMVYYSGEDVRTP